MKYKKQTTSVVDFLPGEVFWCDSKQVQYQSPAQRGFVVVQNVWGRRTVPITDLIKYGNEAIVGVVRPLR